MRCAGDHGHLLPGRYPPLGVSERAYGSGSPFRREVVAEKEDVHYVRPISIVALSAVSSLASARHGFRSRDPERRAIVRLFLRDIRPSVGGDGHVPAREADRHFPLVDRRDLTIRVEVQPCDAPHPTSGIDAIRDGQPPRTPPSKQPGMRRLRRRSPIAVVTGRQSEIRPASSPNSRRSACTGGRRGRPTTTRPGPARRSPGCCAPVWDRQYCRIGPRLVACHPTVHDQPRAVQRELEGEQIRVSMPGKVIRPDGTRVTDHVVTPVGPLSVVNRSRRARTFPLCLPRTRRSSTAQPSCSRS